MLWSYLSTMAAFTFSALNLVFLLVAIDALVTAKEDHSHQQLIQRLFDLASAQQCKANRPLVPLRHWEEHKGVYKSSIKLNLHGPWVMAEGRRLMDVYDNNMFATAWVTSSLLESFRFNRRTRPSQEQLDLALDVLQSHRNKNPPANTSVYTFWRQKFNKTASSWESTPNNLLAGFKLLDDLPLSVIEKILKDIGLKELASVIDDIKDQEEELLQAFHIPPDFDDTFVNLGLGALLSNLKEDFSSAWTKWRKGNINVTSALAALKKYAYRPLSQDPNTNTIDPRTYYYMHQFLDHSVATGQPIALVTTWVQNIEELRHQFYQGVGMPFQMNNVDITVAANTIYGMTSSILAGIFTPEVFNDKDILEIYESTSSLIAFMLNNNITGRPDLALTYYPSQMEFDWFVSRTVAEMNTYMEGKPLPHSAMKKVHGILTSALQGNMTSSILSKAKVNKQGRAYFDDFLGNGDRTLENKPLNRAEDRLFTTSMATNALLYTWTVFNETGHTCRWMPDTPSSVKDTVAKSVGWLTANAVGREFKPWNAFFSGSVKGDGTLPFWYPANVFEHLNGSRIEDWTKYPGHGDILAMRGYVEAGRYQAMVDHQHYHQATPTVFHGYNSGGSDGWFPIWSSDAFTYSTAMVSLSRYDCLQAAGAGP